MSEGDLELNTLVHMPDEILLNIFSHLKWYSLLSLCSVNKQFNRLASDDALWQKLYRQRWGCDDKTNEASGEGACEDWKNEYKRKRALCWANLNESAAQQTISKFLSDECIAAENDAIGKVKYLFPAFRTPAPNQSTNYERGGLALEPKTAPISDAVLGKLIAGDSSLCRAFMGLLAPSLVGVTIERALSFLMQFILVTSSQQLRVILREFALAYYETNLGGDKSLQLPRDAVYLVCHCALMLHSDLVSASVNEKMKVDRFVTLCSSCMGLSDIDENYLRDLYKRVYDSRKVLFDRKRKMHL